MYCSLVSNFGSPLFLVIQSLLETVSYKQEQRSRDLLKPEGGKFIRMDALSKNNRNMVHKIGLAITPTCLENVAHGKKTCEDIPENMGCRKKASNPTKNCSSTTHVNYICLKTKRKSAVRFLINNAGLMLSANYKMEVLPHKQQRYRKCSLDL